MESEFLKYVMPREGETYLARYIIAREQTLSGVHICDFGFSTIMSRYDALHDPNALFFDLLHGGFCSDVGAS